MCLVSILVFDFYLAEVFLFVITDDDIESLWKINKEECDMSSVPYHSNNSVMPVRVTIYEAVNILKSKLMKSLQPVKYGVMRSMGTLRYPSIFSLR